MHGTFMRENREGPCSPTPLITAGAAREGRGRKPEMNEPGQSYSRVVPARPSNNAVGGEVAQTQTAAEAAEERRLAKGNTDGTARSGRRTGRRVSPGLDRVREAAERDREARFTTLLHHVDTDCLRAAYRALRAGAAAGADGVTWEAYGEDLEANLEDLRRRLHSGAY